jgi:protein gp37
MGKQTKIEWTSIYDNGEQLPGATWNPWYGCKKVSPGCKNCYMYRDMEQYGRDPFTITRSKTTFNDPLKWKQPRGIFTCSWSDFFISEADSWRGEAWEIILNTPHTYLILTKRIERVLNCLPRNYSFENVWLGVSCENQEEADKRIPFLLELRDLFPILFVSAEPLLGPIDFWDAHYRYPDRSWGSAFGWGDGIKWVIVGGESGPNYRPMNHKWADDIRQECEAADVSFFMKQDAGIRPGVYDDLPSNLKIREFPMYQNTNRIPLGGTK